MPCCDRFWQRGTRRARPVGTLVIQSHRQPLPAGWLETCCESVRRWAAVRGYGYRFLGDELFHGVAPDLLEKTRDQPVVASDLARLCALQAALDGGADQAVWLDADVLVLAPERFALSPADAQFGREVWVQRKDGGELKAYRKIHNAVMAFRRDEPVLPFYRFAAERILRRHRSASGHMVPQLLGPKLLSLLHNAIGFDVLETAGVLSPPVVRDLLAGGGRALEVFRARSGAAPLAVNLCASTVAEGALHPEDMQRLVGLLGERPHLLSW